MLDVTVEPEANSIFDSEPISFADLKLSASDGSELENKSFSELQYIARQAVEKNIRANPKEADTIRTVAETIFGPLILDPRLINHAAQSEKEAAVSARMQQNLVHALLFCAYGDPNPQYLESVYSLVALLQKIQPTKPGAEANLFMWWNAVKAESGLIKSVLDQDFAVRIPNYSPKSNETLEVDVRGGIDVMVKSPKNSLTCVDVKSDSKLQSGFRASPIMEMPQQRLARLDSTTQKLLRTSGYRVINEAIIWVSTEPRFQSNLDITDPDHRKALRNYCNLNPIVQKGIISVLGS